MGRFAELFLGMARRSENDGTYVSTEQIAKSVSATGATNSRGKTYSSEANKGAAGLWRKEIQDAFNEGRTEDGYLLQASYKKKRG